MKKGNIQIALACATAMVSMLSASARSQKPSEPAGRLFRIDSIQEVRVDPCRSRLQVDYFIDPSVSQPCFIAVRIPGSSGRAGFEVTAAGGRRGVPKGEQSYGEPTAVELHYLGLEPLESARVDVSIGDASGSLYTKTFPWSRLWARFAIQGIRPFTVTPGSAQIRVRYFIDPSYPDACYISGFVSGMNSSSNDFKNYPAGGVPTGVPKGQIGFADGIGFGLVYQGEGTCRSSRLDVIIYRGPKQNLLVTSFAWEKAWRSALAKR